MLRVLITGCRGGFGLQTAEKLLEKGHFVYVTLHREESVLEVREKLKKFKKNVLVEKLDINDSEDRQKVLNWDIDVLVNNAAIGNSGPLIEIDIELIRKVMETNVFSTIALTQLVVRKMIESGVKDKTKRVVIIGSIYGLVPTPFLVPYGITKFALENVVFSLRSELKQFGIPVIMVNPGAYNTGFNKKNIDKKYEWFDEQGYYKEHISEIKKAEEFIFNFERNDLNGLTDKIVKAVTDKNPKRRYKAPLSQWMLIPFGRRFT